jgi:hypothetical protein
MIYANFAHDEKTGIFMDLRRCDTNETGLSSFIFLLSSHFIQSDSE